MFQLFTGNKACRGAAKTLFLTVGILLLANQAATAQDVTECDRLAAVPGDPEAVAFGVEIWNLDIDAAVGACERAVAKFPTTDRFRFQLITMKIYQNRKLEASFANEIGALEKLGASGYQHAYFMLGRINGDKFFHREKALLASRYYEKAIALGSWPAKIAASSIYLSSKNVDIFLDEHRDLGKKWLSEGASAGIKEAQHALGWQLIKSDPEHALNMFEMSAKKGHALAMHSLFLFFSDEDSNRFDKAKAKYWLERSAQTGFPLAEIAISYEYQFGSVFPEDPKKAFEWMIKFAASMDDTESERTMNKLRKSLRHTFAKEIEIYKSEPGKK
jgi:hypothetical protein